MWVGTCLRFLQDQKKDMKAHGKGFAIANIESFLAALDDLDLHVTKRAAYKLENVLKKLKKKKKDEVLTVEEASEVCAAASDARQTFEAETKGVYIYTVTEKRLDVKKLIDNPRDLFAPDVYDLCPDVARYDFAEAGRCVAFERPTAAAFHILRGSESVLREYYKRHVRPAVEGLTWGQMTHPLRQKNRGKLPDPVILNQLDHIRNAFRNPTQHPDKIYDIQEVQDLLSLCVDIVNRMSVAINA